MSELTRRHLTRLRQVYRSSGWPCHDPLEVDLRVAAHAHNRASRTAHDELVLAGKLRAQSR